MQWIAALALAAALMVGSLPAAAQPAPETPLLVPAASSRDLVLSLAEYIGNANGWKWEARPGKNPGEMYATFPFTFSERNYHGRVNISVITSLKKEDKVTSVWIRINTYLNESKGKLSDKAKALEEINAWKLNKLMPSGIYIYEDGELGAEHCILVDETGPVHPRQVARTMSIFVRSFDELVDQLLAKGLLAAGEAAPAEAVGAK